MYLYDHEQAEALARYMREQGISTNVAVEAVPDAGILNVVRPKAAGWKPTGEIDHRTEEERCEERRARAAERQRKRREKERATKVLAGTMQPRGRPRKGSACPAGQQG